MTILKVALAALAAAVLAPAAAADNNRAQEAFAFEIPVGADDVTTAEDASKFLNRLERRVRQECGSGDVRRSMAASVAQHRKDVKVCVDATMRSAVDGLRSPTIAQAYDLRRG